MRLEWVSYLIDWCVPAYCWSPLSNYPFYISVAIDATTTSTCEKRKGIDFVMCLCGAIETATIHAAQIISPPTSHSADTRADQPDSPVQRQPQSGLIAAPSTPAGSSASPVKTTTVTTEKPNNTLTTASSQQHHHPPLIQPLFHHLL
uniref:Uncharacterized protein n=1 Tax=Ditylenchus dipsaci TaxID=166011 RepID=A0A915D7D5_9BILA